MARTVMTWKDGSTARLYEFDAVEEEAPGEEVAITEYPIELGSNLIDHVRPKPVTLRLVAIVSNAPARQDGLSHLDGATAVRELTLYVREPILNTPPAAQIPQIIAGVSLVERNVPVKAVVRTWAPFEAKLQRVEKIYAELRDAMYKAREFTVTIELVGEYPRMLLKSVRTRRDGKSGNSLRIEMDMQQVTYGSVVYDDVSSLLPKKKPKEKRSEPEADAGKPAEETPTEAEETFSHRLGDQIKRSLFERTTAPVP